MASVSPLTEFRRKHRGGQGVGLISLEGRKTGDVAAVQQVTEEDEELLLISAGGQVIRTETNTINRYSSSARGVIVMRLAEGDRVVAIAAFRAGLAEQDGMGDDGEPGTDGTSPPARGRADEVGVTAFSAFGGREAAGLYADQFEIYHGNSNPGLARKICRYLGREPGKRRSSSSPTRTSSSRSSRTSARRTSSSSSRPATRSTSRSWSC